MCMIINGRAKLNICMSVYIERTACVCIYRELHVYIYIYIYTRHMHIGKAGYIVQQDTVAPIIMSSYLCMVKM